jgi:hypothetical protein
MAPQDNDTTDARLILDAMYAGGELQIDWKEVAKAFNITLPGNAYVNSSINRDLTLMSSETANSKISSRSMGTSTTEGRIG